MKIITIVIADNSAIVRNHMRELLEIEKDVHIIGEAAGGPEAVQLAKHLKPNILIVDMVIGHMTGIELIKRVIKNSPGTSVIIFSMNTDRAYIAESLKAGAKAYVAKDSNPDELVRTVRQVAINQHHHTLPQSKKSGETQTDKFSSKDKEQ